MGQGSAGYNASILEICDLVITEEGSGNIFWFLCIDQHCIFVFSGVDRWLIGVECEWCDYNNIADWALNETNILAFGEIFEEQQILIWDGNSDHKFVWDSV